MPFKKTPWLPGSVKPIRSGVYERRYPTGAISFSKWDGKRWRVQGFSVGIANNIPEVSMWQDLPWRGLAREQK